MDILHEDWSQGPARGRVRALRHNHERSSITRNCSISVGRTNERGRPVLRAALAASLGEMVVGFSLSRKELGEFRPPQTSQREARKTGSLSRQRPCRRMAAHLNYSSPDQAKKVCFSGGDYPRLMAVMQLAKEVCAMRFLPMCRP